MATPKRVKREERDYADIYQENFVRNNDPAALGQAAFNRQLSSGIQRNMGQERLAANTVMPPVVPGLSGAGGQRQATAMERAMIGNDQLIGQEQRNANISATQAAGYSPNDNAAMAMQRRAGAMARAQQGEAGLSGVPRSMPSLENIGYSPAALARASQGEVGLTDPNFRTQLGDAANDPNIDRRVAAERRAEQGEVGLTDTTGPSIESQFRARQVTPAQRRAEQGEVGLTDGVLPSLERMEGIMPSELGDPIDYTGAGLQEVPEVDEAVNQAYLNDLERGLLDPETYEFKKPEDGPQPPFVGGGGGDDSPKVTPRTQTGASSGISREEQNLYDTLDAETNAVLSDYNRKYNQFMQLAINRGAVRGNLEQQGFTGGIGQQVQDYLSTQEMQMLNQIITEKDRALQEIELRRNQVPDLALQNEAQRLQLAQANIGLKTQFAQDLAASVVSGMKSLDEAQKFAEEHGLEDIQDLIIKAAKAEIAAGADEATVRESLVAAGISEELLDGEDIDGFETDYTEVSNNFLLLADKALEKADKNEASLDSFFDNIVSTGEFNIIESLAGGASGIFIGIASLLGATPDYGVGVEDRSVLTGDLMASSFFQAFGADLQSKEGMSQNISFVRDAATQGAGLGYYNDIYRINVDGNLYEMKGVDVVTLVATLKQGNFNIPPQLKKLAEEVYNEGLGQGFARFGQAFGGKEDYADSLYETMFNKPARKMSARDIRNRT